MVACAGDSDDEGAMSGTDYVRMYYPEASGMSIDFIIDGATANVKREEDIFDGGSYLGNQREIRYVFSGDIPDGLYTLTTVLVSGDPSGFIIEASTNDGIGGGFVDANFGRTTTEIVVQMQVSGDDVEFIL